MQSCLKGKNNHTPPVKQVQYHLQQLHTEYTFSYTFAMTRKVHALKSFL